MLEETRKAVELSIEKCAMNRNRIGLALSRLATWRCKTFGHKEISIDVPPGVTVSGIVKEAVMCKRCRTFWIIWTSWEE